MTKQILLLFTCSIIASCTITKRVHRPGFHVEWRKIKKSNCEVAKTVSTVPENITHSNVSTDIPEQSDYFLSSVDVIPIELESSEPTTVSIIHAAQTESKTINHIDVEKAIIESNTKQSRPIFWRVPARTLKIIGVVMMWTGAVILLTSLLMLAGLFSSSGASFISFIADVLTSFNLIWLFILLIILIVAIYLLFLLIEFVLGGPLIATFIGIGILGIGLFFYLLGQNRPRE